MVGGTDRVSENSGKALSGFQSVVPSACTSVSARTRFSAIQRRIWSPLMGPYCWPSAPIILYIGFWWTATLWDRHDNFDNTFALIVRQKRNFSITFVWKFCNSSAPKILQNLRYW